MPSKTPTTSRRPFDQHEAASILLAARQETGWLRWLPWVPAFTGCRLDEACRARKEDIRRTETGAWVFDVQPPRDRWEVIPVIGGKLSPHLSAPNPNYLQVQRLVPLHPTLIEEGFTRYVEELPAGSSLFPDLAVGALSSSATVASRNLQPRLRKLAIRDPAKTSAVSWRLRFARQLEAAGVGHQVVAALLGEPHRKNGGDGYGEGLRGRPDETSRALAAMRSPLVGLHDYVLWQRTVPWLKRGKTARVVVMDGGVPWFVLADVYGEPREQDRPGRNSPFGRALRAGELCWVLVRNPEGAPYHAAAVPAEGLCRLLDYEHGSGAVAEWIADVVRPVCEELKHTKRRQPRRAAARLITSGDARAR